MPYEHFGKIGDIWKHLPLCEVISIENPKVYIETNSAYPEYSLSKSDEQKYGIYTFIDKAVYFPLLNKSKYFELISPFVKQDKYLGSSGLAFSLLKNSADELIYFDLDKEACNSIKSYSNRNNITANINVFNLDSIVGVMDLIPDLPKSTLIHIDPYVIDQPASNGMTYLDLFIKTSEQGLKCFLWYGFITLNNKYQLNDYIKNKLALSDVSSVHCCELIMKSIQKDSVLCNPGVLGCGILTSNLSIDSNNIIFEYADLLVDLYKGTKYCVLLAIYIK